MFDTIECTCSHDQGVRHMVYMQNSMTMPKTTGSLICLPPVPALCWERSLSGNLCRHDLRSLWFAYCAPASCQLEASCTELPQDCRNCCSAHKSKACQEWVQRQDLPSQCLRPRCSTSFLRVSRTALLPVRNSELGIQRDRRAYVSAAAHRADLICKTPKDT